MLGRRALAVAEMDDKNNVPSFIGKLAMMLKDKSAIPYVTWSQEGESLVVIDPPTFATQVLPRCFSLPVFWPPHPGAASVGQRMLSCA